MMKKHVLSLLALCAWLCLVAGTASAHIVATAGGKVSLIKSGDVATTLTSLTAAGAGPVAYGELISTSPGEEYAVATGAVLTIYANDLSTVLGTRDFAADNVAEILSLSIGECRSDLAGNELAVGTRPASGDALLFILNPEGGSLAQVNGTGAGTLQVSAVCIADVDAAHAGGEVIFTWEYQAGFVQIAVIAPSAASFTPFKIWNVGGVCKDMIRVGDLNNDGKNEFVVALDNHDFYVCTTNVAVAGNDLAIYFIGSSGFGSGAACADIGEMDATHAGQELVLGSASGDVQVFKVDDAGAFTALWAYKFGGAVNKVLVGDFGDQLLGNEIAAATAENGGSLAILQQGTAGALVSFGSAKTGLGAWTDLDLAPSTPLVPVELSTFNAE